MSTIDSKVTDAVLKPSAPVADGSREVQGIDFNQYASRNITVDELIGGYANMGFQATSVGEAVRIINDMVSCSRPCLVGGWRRRSGNYPCGNAKQFSRIQQRGA